MKKTLTINLGGIVFHIDEDAFVTLKNYLDTIKGYFGNSESREEIMSDIESRIAEMLQDKLSNSKQVINSQDISEIISVMGQPEDYLSEEMEEETSYHRQNAQYSNSNPKKKLYRDIDESMAGGVCSGIGHYFGIDAIWIRLAFIVAFFAGLSGILIYLILWVIMPPAKTPSEKLSMRGEPVTFDNIGKKVEEEFENVKKKLNNLDESKFVPNGAAIENFANKIANFFVSILKFLVAAIGKILGFIFLILGFTFLISLLFGTLTPFNQVFFESNDVIVGQSLSELSEILFTSGADFWISFSGLLLLLGIPFLALFMAGLTLLFNAKFPRYTGLGMAGAWVIGLILLAIGALNTVTDFSKESQVTESVSIPLGSGDTLSLDLIPSDLGRNGEADNLFHLNNGELRMDGIDVDILPSSRNLVEIEIGKSARGNTYEAADYRARQIEFKTEVDSNEIRIEPNFMIYTSDKWRQQNVRVNVFLPVGKTVYIPRSYKYLLDDVANYHHAYDHEMVDKYWTMTDSGLVSPSYLQQLEDEIEIAD